MPTSYVSRLRPSDVSAPLSSQCRPLTEDGVATDSAAFENDKVQAEFSSKVPGVQLYWQDSLWGDMGPDTVPQKVNTYRGHVWNVRKGDEIVHTFKVSGPRDTQKEVPCFSPTFVF